MTAAEIRNLLAILRSIDQGDIREAGHPIADDEWCLFRDDPYRGFLRACDGFQSALVDIINRRLAGG